MGEYLVIPDTLRSGVRQSHANLWHRCPTQLWFYLYSGPMKPSIYRITGSAGHAAIEFDMIHRLETGESRKISEVLDIFTSNYDAGLLTLDSTEGVDPKRLRDRITGYGNEPGSLPLIIRQTARLTPKLVEKPFSLDIEGIDVPIVGTIDFFASDGTLRDFKFRIGARTPTQNDIDRSFQLTTYQLGLVSLGEHVRTVGEFEILANPSKSAGVVEISAPPRSDRELEGALDEFTSIVRFVDLANGDPGLYPKTSPQNWWCGEKWCGWWNKCPRGGGKYE